MSSIIPAALSDDLLEEMWFGIPPDATAIDKATQSLAAGVAAARGLKTFPAAALRAMRMLIDPNADFAEIERVLSAEPALVAKILSVANSALYRPVVPITSMGEAIVRIGMREVRDLVAGVAALGMFRDSGGIARRFRGHCVRVGAVNRVLTTEWGGKQLDDAFLCGLLHDVGKLLSQQVGEMSYAQLPDDVMGATDRTHLAEREALGYDHAVLGAHVLDHWRLPETVVHVVAHHHNLALAWERDPDIGLGVALLRIADVIETALHHEQPYESVVEAIAQSPEAQYAGFEATILELMWPKLASACAELDSLLG